MHDGLADLLSHVDENVQFSADYFAEELTYTPAGGDPRTVTGCVTTTWDELAEEAAADEAETVRVYCLRDPAATPGGIAAPRTGDTIARSDGTVYWFLRLSMTDATDRAWSLLFQRRKRIEQGAPR